MVTDWTSSCHPSVARVSLYEQYQQNQDGGDRRPSQVLLADRLGPVDYALLLKPACYQEEVGQREHPCGQTHDDQLSNSEYHDSRSFLFAVPLTIEDSARRRSAQGLSQR